MEGEIIDNLKEKIQLVTLKKIIDENNNLIKNNKNTDDSSCEHIV